MLFAHGRAEISMSLAFHSFEMIQKEVPLSASIWGITQEF